MVDPRRDPLDPWIPWGPVLDDLEDRVAAAESGDLAALNGWEPPAVQPRPMEPADQQRATGILVRQRALLAQLRDERNEVAAALSAMRRPAPRPAATSVPVYIDRMG